MTENQEAVDLAREFPLLWGEAQKYDFAERAGGSTSAMAAEIDRALHELWLARRNPCKECGHPK